MLPASELRPGMAVRIEGTLYKVVAAEYHFGGGKMGGFTHARLQNLDTGHQREWRFRGEETVDQIEPERQTMQFLYAADNVSYFMHPESFEQVAIENERLGRAASYLREGMSVSVEFVDARPVSIVFPDSVEVRIADTAAPIHGQGVSNVWKEARLENGLTIMVPPFIGPGETIRVQVETGAYVSRERAGRG